MLSGCFPSRVSLWNLFVCRRAEAKFMKETNSHHLRGPTHHKWGFQYNHFKYSWSQQEDMQLGYYVNSSLWVWHIVVLVRHRTTGICLLLVILTLCNRKQRFGPPSALYSQGCSTHAASLKNINTITKLFWVVYLLLLYGDIQLVLVPVRFSWTLRTETRSPLRGTVAPRGE